MQKIFITGVAGFLGSHLADYFISRGYNVAGCDNLFGGTMDNVNPQVEFFNHDITNLTGFADIMQNCDVVYHTAAAPYEGVSVFAPGFICENIFTGSVNTFTAAIQAGASKIVYCSSMARYGTNQPPFFEYYEPRPQDPYGIAKEAAERVLINLCETHGVEYVIAVPHSIYGPRQKYDDPYRNVASIMTNLMLQGRAPIIYGDGEQRRCFSYITDCVGILGAMATDPRASGEIINIGPDEEFISINELANKLANITGCNLSPIYMPDRPKEVKLATCSADKARRLLGYQTKVFIDDGLKELVNWIKDQGTKPFGYHFDVEISNHLLPQTWRDRLF
jgi:UDP-glucose 4-epimerase